MAAALKAYLGALLAVAVMDGLWLGVLAADFYARELGPLMGPIQALPTAVFYLGYPAGLVALALTPRPATLGGAALRGAVLGAAAYGVYDMTNWATLRGFSPTLALTDWAWGMLVSAVGGAAGWRASAPRAQGGATPA
jgi:uncharacterized membrane protein